MPVFCEYTKMVPVGDLKPNPKNPNRHSQDQIRLLAKILKENGFRAPITVSNRSGFIVRGHGRLIAAKVAGFEEVPVDFQDYETEEAELADLLADNRISELSENDENALAAIIGELQAADFDIELAGYEIEEAEDEAEKEKQEAYETLKERFIVPPISIFDSRQGYWQERKKAWKAIGIESAEGRGEDLTFGAHIPGMENYRTSIFDPVTAEVCYSWFSPQNATILDPFCGGSVRGIVAERMGRGYIGFDIRREQIEANQKNADEMGIDGPMWICDDATNLLEHVEPESVDMVFTCPPYADLEVYSQDERDISNKEYGEFIRLYREIIDNAAKALKKNRFAVFVVGDVRDKRGAYRGFVEDTKRALIDAGLVLYNEIIYIEQVGSAAYRAAKNMNATRKATKTQQEVIVAFKESGGETCRPIQQAHEEVVVAYKGDPKAIKSNFPPVFDAAELIEVE